MKSSSASDKFALGVAVIILSAIVMAVALFLPIRGEVVQYDEAGYTHAALRIRDDGLFSNFTFADQRTYLYPGLLALSAKKLDVSAPSTRSSAFILQSILFFAGALLISLGLRARFGTGPALWVLAAICLNPINLLYLGYVLTESISLILTLALVTSLALSFGSKPGLTIRNALISGLILGTALMIRPGTIYLVALVGAALALHLYQALRAGQAGRTILTCLIAIGCTGLVTVPQLINNYRNFGKLSPLVVHKAGSTQFSMGRTNLKYGTFVGPGNSPGLEYRNPFYPGGSDEGLSFLQRSKARILSTAAKMFALVDQDFIRPYIYSLTSPDRWIGTILSLTLFCLGALGLSRQAWAACRALWQGRFQRLSSEHAFALAALGGVAACFALYSQVQVESRFGLPILALSTLFIPAALEFVRSLSSSLKAFAVAAFLLVIGVGCYFSHWIQTLSEPIVKAWS